MKFYIYVIFFVLLGIDTVFTQDNLLKRNIEIFDELLDSSFLNIENELLILGNDKCYYLTFDKFSEKEQYFLKKIKSNFNSYKILTGEARKEFFKDSCYNIRISQLDLNVNYPNVFTKSILGDKFIKRSISFKYNITIDKFDSVKTLYKNNFVKKYSDSFEYNEYDKVQQGDLKFLKADLPEESFVNKILIPSLILVSTAVVAILFFSIRSK